MNGLGFLIWQLKSMPAVEVVIHYLKAVKARWVSIKVANGAYTFNVDGGNDKPLIAFMDALRTEGIEVGGWHYVYPDNPGPQGDRAEERRQKLGLAHLLVDAETEWNEPFGMTAAAKLYLSKIKIANFPTGLCSYRFPRYFPNFPFAGFCNHESSDLVAPQVYWEGAHNPVVQLARSKEEYAAITDRPFVPIGATYGHVQKDQSWWEPSVDDLTAFTEWCKANVHAYGYYSLDWILTHNRMDWLEAINGGPLIEPPPPPPPSVIEPIGDFVVSSAYRNLRIAPGATAPDTIIGAAQRGSKLPYTEQQGNWYRVDAWVWRADNE